MGVAGRLLGLLFYMVAFLHLCLSISTEVILSFHGKSDKIAVINLWGMRDQAGSGRALGVKLMSLYLGVGLLAKLRF